MAKKEKFSVDGSALFGNMTQEEIREAVVKKTGRPQNENLVRENGSQKGLPVELTRQTLIVSVEQMETLKNYAYTERMKLKDVVSEAFKEYIENHVNPETLLTRPAGWK